MRHHTQFNITFHLFKYCSPPSNDGNDEYDAKMPLIFIKVEWRGKICAKVFIDNYQPHIGSWHNIIERRSFFSNLLFLN